MKQGEEDYAQYYFLHSKEISDARYNCEKVLKILKFDLKKISHYSFLDNKVLIEKQTARLIYKIKIISKEIKESQIVFDTSLKIFHAEPVVRTFCDKSLKFKLSKNYSFTQVAQIIFEVLEKQEAGIRSENLFLNSFLIPLKKIYKVIEYAHYSGERKDLKKGVDFVVGYKPRKDGNVFEIPFQLKSSNRFFKEHKEKYPDISVFCFKFHYLDNRDRLARNFLKFLNTVLREKVVYWE